jgi:hypothetical protein
MSFQFKKYKRIFRRNLQPVFASVLARKRNMEFSSWKELVNETLQHVVNNPVEYLGDDLPDKSLLVDILEEIRDEFLKEITAFRAVPRH